MLPNAWVMERFGENATKGYKYGLSVNLSSLFTDCWQRGALLRFDWSAVERSRALAADL